VISETAAGDMFPLSELATLVWAGRRFVSVGMQFSVQCNEEVPFTSQEAVNAVLDEHPGLAIVFSGSTNLGSGVFGVCDLWGTQAPSDEENEAVVSEIPTLVLAGEYDPVTPPSWGERVTETLDAATFLEIPGAGHGPSATLECPQEVMRDFLAAPGSPVDAACVADMGSPSFTTPADFSAAIELEPFVHEMLGVRLSGVAPAAWHWQGSGTWTRSASPLDQTSLIQQPVPALRPVDVLPSAITQFGLGGEPAGEHSTDMGDWILYEGSQIGESVTVALLEVDAGTLLVAMHAAPSEADLLRTEVLFPVLDALTSG
jgi:hypothetical protein